jgi:peptidoglycan/xylan/chitin deacetylase (PgdA/CDA1 family)
MIKKLHFLLLWVMDLSGINALNRLINRNKAVILMYHGIYHKDFDLLKGFDERHINQSSFRRQLKYLKNQKYKFIGITELVDCIKKRKRIGKCVVLTFDDGFKNVVENAYPIMKEYGIKGCFYLVSGLIGTDRLLWTDYVETVVRNQERGDFQITYKDEKVNYRLEDRESYQYAMQDIKLKFCSIPDKERREHLAQFAACNLINIPREFTFATWEQLRVLDPDIFEIGGHTRMHPFCSNLTSDEELTDEIYNSKIEIEQNTGQSVKHFCYPSGSYNEKVATVVKKYGYESAVTVIYGFNDLDTDLYQLKRMEASENLLLFKAMVSGSYNIIRIIKAIIRRNGSRY